MRDRSFRLDHKALAQARVGADSPLALRQSAWGTVFTLAEAPPSPPSPDDLGVTLVSIEGPLAQEADQLCGWWDGYGGQNGITARITAALKDPGAGSVVVRFNSPGGVVAGLEESLRRMVAAREASGKEVFGIIDEECCSAAYRIAAVLCTAGLYSPVSGQTGSIGTYCAHVDESAALAEEGLAVTVIADPPGKVALASHQPLSELGRARLVRDIGALTERFIADVASARGVSPDAVRALDGDVREGPAAEAAGLIDGIGSLEDVMALATAAAGRKGTSAMRSAALRGAVNMLDAAASDAQVDAALIQYAGLGRTVQSKLGADSPDAALGTLEAKLGEAAEAPGLREQLAAANAEIARMTRERVLEDAVRAKKLDPGRAWSFSIGPKGEKVRSFSEWAGPVMTTADGRQVGQSLDQLHAYLRGVSARADGTPPDPAPTTAPVGLLTAQELAVCKARGWKPEDFAAHKARIFPGG